MPIPALSARCDTPRTRGAALHWHYPASTLLSPPPTSATACLLQTGDRDSGPPCQISRVAWCGFCTCCAPYPGGGGRALRFSHSATAGLRRYQGGSTPVLNLSRPAQASLALRPVQLLISHS